MGVLHPENILKSFDFPISDVQKHSPTPLSRYVSIPVSAPADLCRSPPLKLFQRSATSLDSSCSTKLSFPQLSSSSCLQPSPVADRRQPLVECAKSPPVSRPHSERITMITAAPTMLVGSHHACAIWLSPLMTLTLPSHRCAESTTFSTTTNRIPVPTAMDIATDRTSCSESYTRTSL